jgi:lysophospholipase L1-like esterase
MKQGRAFGGEAVPIIALGINDSFGTNPTAIATNAEAIVDDFIAQGAPEIFGILPLRPASFWSSSYTGGRTFTPAQGAIAGVYRRKGVKIIPMPVDFLGRSLFQDGLHPNVLGNDTYAQLCIEGICKR